MHRANSEEVNTTLEIVIFDLILQTDREQPPAEHDPSAGLEEEGEEEEEAKESDVELQPDPSEAEPESETDRPHKKIRSDKVL